MSSLIIAIPVLLWAVSGFLHPIMTNIRPQVVTQGIAPAVIDSGKVKVSLQAALQQNKVDSIYSFRFIHIDTNWFYQVKTVVDDELQYYSALTGKRLKKGDVLYAQYLARLFLEGPPHAHDLGKHTPATDAPATHDCCDAATSCVLYNPTGAGVEDVTRVTDFDKEYKSINRLLPVYKVAFNREDGIRIYVETGQSRFALAVDNKRAAFTQFFTLVHTFGWLSFLGVGRLWVEALLCALAFITTLMGLYIFFITKTKKANGNSVVKARRNHRYTALVASLFTLMFTFSGAWHALDKVNGEVEEVHTALPAIAVTAIHDSLPALQAVVQQPITNLGLVQLQNKWCWQVYTASKGKAPAGGKDLMKEMKAAPAQVCYVDAASYRLYPQAEQQYAKSLAGYFTGYDTADITSVTLVTAFNEEYNFADKRLPVWRVQYKRNKGERVYVETGSAVLAKQITDKDLYQGYSFALLHKHHFMDFAGKAWRDASTLFWVFVQIVMVVMGLVLYFRWRNKKR
ncbi:optional hypothetical component of the B12 transporter BtuN [Filimonas lacunae]|nr:optional hypothetical component of the B12 transporter BtuN [Filimonas lacunae]